MDEPRLTIAIPTLNRPEFLRKLLESIEAQTVRPHIVIGDQGGKKGTRNVLREFSGRLEIEHRLTKATSLWDNWKKSIANCQTAYAAWVQDDDVLSPFYTARIVSGLNAHPKSTVYMCRLMVSYNTLGYACWWEGNGPPIPLDFLNFRMDEVNGDLLLAIAPFISGALSPGIAFRMAPGFDEMLASLPDDCDLFHERMHVIEWVKGGGRLLCDPWVGGYWTMHDGNVSKVMNKDRALQKRQLGVLMKWLEPRLHAPDFDWADMIKSWVVLVSPGTLSTCLGTLTRYRHHAIAREAKRMILGFVPKLRASYPRFPIGT